MIITVASQHGAGKSTAVDLLLKRFPRMRKLEMGAKFRQLAEKHGMTIDDYISWLTKNPKESGRVDREMDEYQKSEIAKGNILVDSNLGALFAPNADVRVLITCPAEVRARRVLADPSRKGDKKAASVSQEASTLKERDENDRKRYLKLYKFDMFDPKNYDVVIDTAKTPKDAVVNRIITAKGAKK